MTARPDLGGSAEECGERRRRAEMLHQPLLRALGLAAHDRAGCSDATRATMHATSDLLSDTFAELGEVEEELRMQNEALFAARFELEQEQQVFRDLFDLAPTASLVTTETGRILRLNQAALDLFARPTNALVGKPLAAYVALGDRPAFRTALCRSLRSPRVETWPVRLLPKHGAPIDCRVRTRVLHPLPPGASAPNAPDAPPDPALYWVVTEEFDHSTDDLA